MSWFSETFGGGGRNPAEAAMPYINQIPGATNQYMQPYFQAGTGSLPILQEQYKNLLGDPGALMNKIGSSYQQSPGYKFALEQALAAGEHVANAGGMGGTPQHQFQAQQTATGLANQDYYNYLQNALGLYGQGLSGQQGMAGMGMQAGGSMADYIANTLSQQANFAFRGQQEKNSMNNSTLGGLGRIAGTLGGTGLGYLAGGPWGAFAGWNMANRGFGGQQ